MLQTLLHSGAAHPMLWLVIGGVVFVLVGAIIGTIAFAKYKMKEKALREETDMDVEEMDFNEVWNTDVPE